MTIPDKTDPDLPGRRSGGRSDEAAGPTANGQAPQPRDTTEHVPVQDDPLHVREPVAKLQHRALNSWTLAIVVTGGCTGVVAVATGSVPATLLVALVLIAAAFPAIVRHVFPK